MTVSDFYHFCVLMKKDSNILFSSNAYHNSVYLGAFVLEGYIKILLIKSGANTVSGNGNNSYGGHIKGINCAMIQRLNSLNPTEFSNSILVNGHIKYPFALLSNNYDINFRYEVLKWTNSVYSHTVQNEIEDIINELINLRIQGLIQI